MADTKNFTRSTLIGSAPVPFTGTEDERRANSATHMWMSYDPDERMECDVCCCKAGSVTSGWPCGECPRYEAHQLHAGEFGLRVSWGGVAGMVVVDDGTMPGALKSRRMYREAGVAADQLELVVQVSRIGWVSVADAFGYYDGTVWEDRDGSGWLMMRAARN